MKLANNLRARVNQGEALFGTFALELTTPAIVPVLKNCGFGFFLIDLEHGCIGDAEMRGLISAGKQYGLCPIARVADAGRATITRALDTGAEGVLVAMVQSMDDVRMAVQASKYPPLGRRGVHMMRPHTDFVPPNDVQAYMEQANRDIITGVMIETTAAVDLIEQIAATPGVDLLYLGPTDLSIALGAPGAKGHDQIMAIAERMVRACRKHGKLAGIHTCETDALVRLIPQGMNLFGHSCDLRLFWSAAQNVMASVRKDLEQIKSKQTEPAS